MPPPTAPHDRSASPSLGRHLSTSPHGQHRSQEMEQLQHLHRASVCAPSETPSAVPNPDVFADEYAIDDSNSLYDAASDAGHGEHQHDGSSPSSSTSQLSTSSPASEPSTAPTARTAAPSHTDESLPPLHQSALPQPSPYPQPSLYPQVRHEVLVNRSSSRKGPRPTSGSYASMHSPSVQSLAASTDDPFNPQRSMSSASSGTFARSHSPFQPGQGPSHPYAMYPQNAGRPSSISTTSTLRSHGAMLPSGPSFPYTLYTQHDFDGDDAAHGFHNPIPLGFNGHFQSFTRQIGPEGEELDIIGPDGHTEQLPPYSRFPDSSPSARSPPHPMPAIGETPQDSMAADDLMQPATRHLTSASHRSHRSHESSDWETTIHGSTLQGSSSNGESSEKTWLQKSWKEKRRTIVCGCLPVWLMWVLLVLLVVIAIIVGSCVGYLNAQHSDSHSSGDDSAAHTVTVTKTQLIDATPLPSGTAAAFAAMPTGRHEVDLSAESYEDYSSCITDFHQEAAWQCVMTSNTITLDIQSDAPNADANYSQSLTVQVSTEPVNSADLIIGELPLNLPPMKLATVIDTDAPDLGPALHFQALYDKVVILPLELLGGSNFANGSKLANDWVPTARRRWIPPNADAHDSYSRIRRDTPFEYYWYCMFNGTFIETFIYLNPNAYIPNTSSPTTSAATTTSTSTSSSSSSKRSAYVSPYERHTAHHSKREVLAAPTSIYSQSAAPTDAATTSPGQAIAAADASPSSSPGGEIATGVQSPAPTASVYPVLERRVKIEERRIRGSPHGVCVLKQYLNDGTLADYPEGNPAIAKISEHDPVVTGISPSRRALANANRRRQTTDNPADSCHCQWEN